MGNLVQNSVKYGRRQFFTVSIQTVSLYLGQFSNFVNFQRILQAQVLWVICLALRRSTWPCWLRQRCKRQLFSFPKSVIIGQAQILYLLVAYSTCITRRTPLMYDLHFCHWCARSTLQLNQLIGPQALNGLPSTTLISGALITHTVDRNLASFIAKHIYFFAMWDE